jgi:hypothetical protein
VTLDTQDVLVGLSAAVLLLGAELAGMPNEMKPYGSPTTIAAVHNELDVARAVARDAQDGATITFTPQTGERTHVEIHRHRPTSASTVSPEATNVLDLGAAVSMTSDAGASDGGPFAIFVTPHGGASAAPWALGGAPLSQEPACASPIVLHFANEGTAQALNVACDDASMSDAGVH